MQNTVPEKTFFYAGGFLYNPQIKEVLLHLRDGNTEVNPHRWAFFGGTSVEGETPEECCIREWKEELDLSVEREKLIPLCSYLNTDRNTWRHVFYIESSLRKNEMALGEGADFDWIPLDKVFEYDLTERTALDLKIFLKNMR